MKNQNIKLGTAFIVMSSLLTACGSPSSTGDQPLLGAAVGSGEPVNNEPAPATFVTLDNEELSDITDVPETKTAELLVQDDFTFTTARLENVSLYIPEASAMEAEASFCTDYTELADGSFDVNYNSCVLTAPLVAGALTEELDLVNQYNKALAVIWLEDTSMPPVFREFQFD